MNKYVITILSALCLCGCNRLIDYNYTHVLFFENKSSHTIEINANPVLSNEDHHPWRCTINPNENYSYTTGGEYPDIDIRFIMGICIVTFDNEIEINHYNTNIEHNICEPESYTVKTSGRHDTKTTYTYVFTDEDYDRAVAANKENEE